MIIEDGNKFLPQDQKIFHDIIPTLIRGKTIAKGQILIRPYRGMSLNKQLYMLLSIYAANGETLTIGEVLRILQGSNSKEEPTTFEKELISTHLARLREWLSDLKLPGHLITYVIRKTLDGYERFGTQSLIEPIWTKVRYDLAAGKHIRKVGGSILERDAENLQCINRGQKKLMKAAYDLQNSIQQQIETPLPLITQKKKRKAKK